MSDRTQFGSPQHDNVLLAFWATQIRPRLVSTLRRPWTVAFLAAFASVAFGFVDLGLGIRVLRLDHPNLGDFSGSWWVLLINSAAFWTGLVLAASRSVVNSWVVYE